MRLATPFLALSLSLAAQAFGQTGRWANIAQGNLPIGREECSFAQAGGRFYLLGGRGRVAVQEFNPATRTWRNLSVVPDEMNHFQAVTLSGLIYVLGAFRGTYPHEEPLPNVLIFDPLTDTWVTGPAIPAARRRGSAGLVERQGKLYSVLGIRDGHSSGWVAWLDEFDPATNAWKTLADAPRGRDHFQAALHGDRIFALGGRRSSYQPDIFTDLEKVDVYDFGTGAWTTLPAAANHPLKRSGSILAVMGDEIVVAGGGSLSNGTNAHAETHAFHAKSLTWRSLASLNRGRQVTGGFVNNGGFYVASGSGGSGGSPVLQTMEAFYLGDSTAPAGEALTAGTLAYPGTAFNFGMVADGQTATRTMALPHAGGTQGVIVASMKVVGDAAFSIKAQVTGPFLVRPGGATSIELAYVSPGTPPAESRLEVTLAVPPGAIVKVPLDANRIPLAALGRPVHRVDCNGPGYSAGAWWFESGVGARTVDGRAREAMAPLPAR